VKWGIKQTDQAIPIDLESIFQKEFALCIVFISEQVDSGIQIGTITN
jgi:hypothetical protein